MSESASTHIQLIDGKWRTPFVIDIAWFKPCSLAIVESTHEGECFMLLDSTQAGIHVNSSTYRISDPQRLLDYLWKSGYRPSEESILAEHESASCCAGTCTADVSERCFIEGSIRPEVATDSNSWNVEQSDEHA